MNSYSDIPRSVPNYPGMTFQESLNFATQEHMMLKAYKEEAAELEEKQAYTPELAKLYMKMGWSAMELWDWEEAVKYLTQSLHLYQAHLQDLSGSAGDYLTPLHRDLARCYAAQAKYAELHADLYLSTISHCRQYLYFDALSYPAALKSDSAWEERHSISIMLGKSLNALGLTQQALQAFLEISTSGSENIDSKTFIEMTLGVAESGYLEGNHASALDAVHMAIGAAKSGGYTDQLGRARLLKETINRSTTAG